MVEVNLKFDQGIPQYGCNSCNDCQSVFGKSLCSVKNRGCCWYFPKFTLYEIHKMVKSKEGLEVLDKIINISDVKIYNYYIHAKGYFDDLGYKKYMENTKTYKFKVKDKSIFFRACPFVKPGVGCTLPKKYRSYVCNFYICDEVVEKVQGNNEFENYIKERNTYVKWIEWENESLQALLHENKLNLINDFNGVINFLKDIPLREYEFPNLRPIRIKEYLDSNMLKAN